jgi:hypothetical protein
MIKGHGIATLQRKIEEVIELAVERRRTRNRQLSGKSIEEQPAAYCGVERVKVAVLFPIVFGATLRVFRN